VYCSQPTGFTDSALPQHVCKLNKSLYGLKQAPRAWHSRFASFLLSLWDSLRPSLIHPSSFTDAAQRLSISCSMWTILSSLPRHSHSSIESLLP
jgi:hypothetical protein